MKTNDIKKGMTLQMRNGWYGTMKDNMRGNTRNVEIRGPYTKLCPVYAWDIMRVSSNDGLTWSDVELSDKQTKIMLVAKSMGR